MRFDVMVVEWEARRDGIAAQAARSGEARPLYTSLSHQVHFQINTPSRIRKD